MSFFDSVSAFIEGLASVVDASGLIQQAASAAISNGIEGAFLKIKKPLEQSLIKISFMLVGVFFIVWGAAIFLDSLTPYHGLGFVVVGALFGIVAMFALQGKESG